MEKHKIAHILKKYLSGRFAPEAEEHVQKWLIKDINQQEKDQASLNYWSELTAEADKDTYTALNRVNHRIGYSKMQKYPLRRKSQYKNMWHIAAVLIPFLLIAGGTIYLSRQKNNMTEVFVAYGEKKQLFLPDSSEIWISAGTTIRYQTAFNGDKRMVYLDGEASFSVRKDTQRPFIVQTEQQSVRVLGTRFNVKAYADDERVITTLASGKVEVHTSTKETKTLHPNEQLIFNKRTAGITITDIPVTETDGWLTGQLIFTEATIDEIIQVLERRFAISIENKINNSLSKQYTIKFLKNERLEEMLIILEEMTGFSYEQDEYKITLINK